MKKTFSILFFILLSAVSCSKAGDQAKNDSDKAKKEEKKEEKKDERVPIELVAVATGYIESHIDASANLETEAQVKVFSRATNLLAELFVEEGDIVAKGDLFGTA